MGDRQVSTRSDEHEVGRRGGNVQPDGNGAPDNRFRPSTSRHGKAQRENKTKKSHEVSVLQMGFT